VVAAEDRAYQAIRSAIIDGTYANGAHIDAGGIANALGISRTPVREAFRRLHAEGLLTLIANRGAYVTPWTRGDLDELFSLRVVLESHAASMAAERLDAAGIAQLRSLADRMEQSVAPHAAPQLPAHSLQAVMTLNAEFHRTIIGASGNRRLTILMSTLVDTPLIMRTFTIYTADDLHRSMAHHRELIAAFEAKDADWAASVMRSHLHAAHQVLLRAQEAAAEEQSGADTTRTPAAKRHAARAREAGTPD
jgi:DNA-binding GntR family transcriptional regulator